MKILTILLGFMNGGFMLIDGIHVLIKGKYIGSEKPGPWANIFSIFKIDVFKLGPLFLIFGIMWLVWVFGLWTDQSWAYIFGIVVSILTLWYLPVGTLFSIIVLAILITAKNKSGI